ncbi:MAG: hypothetical protein A4E55_02389 [Pelotomaculum sp. PtaU1.Bin035]|nr:MAG: hypothetical protein A4E55_02389 [Pelotomaculum sp. PtaU1.Bin035]
MINEEFKRSKTARMVRHVIKLMQSMPTGGLSFDDFFDDEEVDVRTIQRDLADLKKIAEEMGIFFQTPGPGRAKGRYSMDIPLFETADDKRVFIMSLMLERLGSKPWARVQAQPGDQGQLMYQLLRYQKLARYMQKMSERVIFMEPEARDSEGMAEKIDRCMDALAREAVLRIKYKGKVRRVRPLGLICKEERWYLAAFCCEAWDERMFRLDRIESLTTTGERFDYPEDFSLRDHVKNAWSTHLDKKGGLLTIRLLATGMAAEDLQNMTFHPSQQLEAREDGSVLATFQLETWEGMVGWLLRWGTLVEVLEPEDLRQRLKSIAEEITKKYEKPVTL